LLIKWLTHTLSRTNFCAAPTNSFVPLMRLPNFRPTSPTNFFALFRDVWIEKLQEDEGNTKTRLQYKLCSQSPNSRGTFGHTHTHTHTFGPNDEIYCEQVSRRENTLIRGGVGPLKKRSSLKKLVGEVCRKLGIRISGTNEFVQAIQKFVRFCPE
jgi:hypothetical protein